MTVTLFSGVAVAVLAVVVALQAYKGYKRGLTDALIHLAVTVGCAFGSIIVSKSLAEKLGEGLTETVVRTDFYRVLLGWISSADILIGLLLEMLLGILLYLPVFFGLSGVVKLVLKIARKYYRKKHPARPQPYTYENAPDYIKKSNRAGAWVGVLSGIVLSIVLLTPLTATATVANQTVTFCDKYDVLIQVDRKMKKETRQYAEDIACRVVRCCGADMIVNLTTRVEFGGQSTTLYREMETVNQFDLEAFQDTLKRMGSLKQRDLTRVQEQLDVIDNSILLKAMTAETISSLARAWSNGNDFMGVSCPTFNNARLFEPILKGVLSVCQKTTFDTVVSDLRALLDMAKYFTNMKPLLASSDYLSVIQELASTGIGHQFQSEIHHNLTEALMDEAMQNLAVRALLIEMENRGKYTQEAYDGLLEQISTSLNSVQNSNYATQSATVNAHLKKYFKSMGITLPTAVSSVVTEELLEEFSGKGTVDKEMLEEYLNSMKSASVRFDK